jgi:hypothetical protein
MLSCMTTHILSGGYDKEERGTKNKWKNFS